MAYRAALFAGILASLTQWDAVKVFVEDPELGPVRIGIEPIDELLTRGGMASLLTTVWLVLAAMAFAAILVHAGFQQRLLEPVVTRARSRGRLALAVTPRAQSAST